MPSAWMVGSAPEIVPFAALKVIVRPISSEICAVVSTVPAEFCRKLAVSVVDWPRKIGFGDAVCESVIHGVKLAEPVPETTAVSHAALVGPALQPHQLFWAEAAPLTTERPVPVGAVLSTIRQKFIVRLLLVAELSSRTPPPAVVAELLRIVQ